MTIFFTYKNTVGYVECVNIWSKCTEHMTKQTGKHTEESNGTITIPGDELWEYQAWKTMRERDQFTYIIKERVFLEISHLLVFPLPGCTILYFSEFTCHMNTRNNTQIVGFVQREKSYRQLCHKYWKVQTAILTQTSRADILQAVRWKIVHNLHSSLFLTWSQPCCKNNFYRLITSCMRII